MKNYTYDKKVYRRINYVPFISKRLIGLLLLLLLPHPVSPVTSRDHEDDLSDFRRRSTRVSMVVALGRRDTVRLPRARPEETSSALPLLPKPEHGVRERRSSR